MISAETIRQWVDERCDDYLHSGPHAVVPRSPSPKDLEVFARRFLPKIDKRHDGVVTYAVHATPDAGVVGIIAEAWRAWRVRRWGSAADLPLRRRPAPDREWWWSR